MGERATRKESRRPSSGASEQPRRGILLLAGAALLVGLGAWAFLSRSSRTTEAGEVPPTGVKVGQRAPDFTVPTLEGETYTLSEFAGRPRVIFIMAYWCGTCIPEARALGQLKEEFGDRLSILALDVDPSSTPELLARFKSLAGRPDYAWAFDTNQSVAQLFEVTALDTTIILDAQGVIVYRDAFPTHYDILKEELLKLLEAG